MAVLTIGLNNLRNQVNAAFPRRDKKSDGWIGDTAHQSNRSGHNPDDKAGSKPAWDGDPDSTQEVRAWDCDNNLGDPDVDAQDLVNHLRKLSSLKSVIRYMIYNRKMYHQDDGYAPTDYDGPSAHTEHIHFEGAWTQASDNNKTFDFKLEELTMPSADEIATAVINKLRSTDSVLSPATLKLIGDAAANHTEANPQDLDEDGNPKPGRIGGWIRMSELREEDRKAIILAAIQASADEIVANVLAGLATTTAGQ